MIRTAYFFWGLIPAALLFLTIRAAFRIALKRPGREYPLRYLKQSFLSGLVLVVAIYTDQWFVDDLLNFVGQGMLENDIVRWAWYPLLLTVFGYLCKPFDTKPKQVFSEELRARMRLPVR